MPMPERVEMQPIRDTGIRAQRTVHGWREEEAWRQRVGKEEGTCAKLRQRLDETGIASVSVLNGDPAALSMAQLLRETPPPLPIGGAANVQSAAQGRLRAPSPFLPPLNGDPLGGPSGPPAIPGLGPPLTSLREQSHDGRQYDPAAFLTCSGAARAAAATPSAVPSSGSRRPVASTTVAPSANAGRETSLTTLATTADSRAESALLTMETRLLEEQRRCRRAQRELEEVKRLMRVAVDGVGAKKPPPAQRRYPRDHGNLRRSRQTPSPLGVP